MREIVHWDPGVEGVWLHEDDETEMVAEWPVSGQMRSGSIYRFVGDDGSTDAHKELELLGTPRSGSRGVVRDSVHYGNHDSRLEIQVEIITKEAHP